MGNRKPGWVTGAWRYLYFRSGVAYEMGYGSEGLPTVIPVTDIEFIKARTNTVRAINTQKIVANELFITIFTKIIYNMKNYSSFLESVQF